MKNSIVAAAVAVIGAALLVHAFAPVTAAEEPTPQTVNKPPVAIATAESTWGIVPLKACFDASRSYDPEGKPLSFAWDFGDGRGTATTAKACHEYVQAGLYAGYLKVTDDQRLVDAMAFIIFVREKVEEAVAPTTPITQQASSSSQPAAQR